MQKKKLNPKVFESAANIVPNLFNTKWLGCCDALRIALNDMAGEIQFATNCDMFKKSKEAKLFEWLFKPEWSTPCDFWWGDPYDDMPQEYKRECINERLIALYLASEIAKDINKNATQSKGI